MKNTPKSHATQPEPRTSSSPIYPAVTTHESTTTEIRALLSQGRRHIQDINTQSSKNLLPDTETMTKLSDILEKLKVLAYKQQQQLNHHHHNEIILTERCKHQQDTLHTLQANHTEIIKRIPNTTTIIDALRDTLLQQPQRNATLVYTQAPATETSQPQDTSTTQIKTYSEATAQKHESTGPPTQ